jgi:uroporphyrinogen-III decarboxylase
MDIQAAKMADRHLGERGLGIAHMYGPLDQRDVMRQVDFMLLYYDDRNAFREIVDVMSAGMMSETQYALEVGFKIIQTWWFYTSPSYGWGPRIYEEMFLPHLVKHVELVHSYPDTLYIYYDDGRVCPFIDFYVDSGIDCLMTLTPPPVGDADPKFIKERYGDRIALMGGIDVVNEVCFSDPSSIRETVRQRMEIYKPGGGYIFDGSGSIPYETPVENVRALAVAAYEFGAY